MKKIIVVMLMCLTVSGVVFARGTSETAEQFPNKPVQAMVAWAAGGGADLVFRALAAVFPKYANGQPLVITNSGGAAGVPGITQFMQEAPDGYWIMHWNVAHVIKTHMDSVPFTATSFVPVAQVVVASNYLNVRADAPWQTLQDFIADAKKNPGKVSIGNAGAGGGNHMGALLFEKAAGIQLLHVPFTGGGPSVTGLMSGQCDSAMNVAPEGISNAQAGQLRILAVFGGKRFDTFPNVPTGKEAGVDLVLDQWRGIVAPPGTPENIVQALHDIFKKCIEDPEFIAKMKELNATPSYASAKDFGALVAAEDKRYEELIKTNKMGNRYK
ncbi:MAG: tripartite tricarboxylate transporter substrate binding protein [Spirochaetales bacterium]|jgi:tripartite-type tricarboxylate transporter receptor subunit TctC|nr:tripartite tricarboxylate transporter substrate binding protein [Spirochaetales bacterium]